jgi:hypothetical protein
MGQQQSVLAGRQQLSRDVHSVVWQEVSFKVFVPYYTMFEAFASLLHFAPRLFLGLGLDCRTAAAPRMQHAGRTDCNL